MKFHHEHYHYHHGDPQSEARLRRVEHQLGLVLKTLEIIMGKIDDLNAAVTRNTDAYDAVIQLLTGYVQELKDARAANDPAAMDAAIARIDANTAKAAAAVVAHTPAAPSQS